MPHAGLGVGLYVQSTSPIRRFTDLLCHYNLKAWLRKQVPPFNRDRLTELATTQVRLSTACFITNCPHSMAVAYWRTTRDIETFMHGSPFAIYMASQAMRSSADLLKSAFDR